MTQNFEQFSNNQESFNLDILNLEPSEQLSNKPVSLSVYNDLGIHGTNKVITDIKLLLAQDKAKKEQESGVKKNWLVKTKDFFKNFTPKEMLRGVRAMKRDVT